MTSSATFSETHHGRSMETDMNTRDEFDALVSQAKDSSSTALVPTLVAPGPLGVTRREFDDHLEAWARNETYVGISARPVTEEQAHALCEPLTDDEVDIKPDSFGAVYLSHSGYRRRLNKAFRPGGWALRRLSA